jgi:hypothetical protein
MSRLAAQANERERFAKQRALGRCDAPRDNRPSGRRLQGLSGVRRLISWVVFRRLDAAPVGDDQTAVPVAQSDQAGPTRVSLETESGAHGLRSSFNNRHSSINRQ